MPLTFTGRRVRPGGTEHPSIPDIAVGLSRAPRFAGQTRRWFSVLDHSLFIDEMVKRNFAELPHLRMAVLLHDAHEAMTADIPTDWKSADMKSRQVTLDHKIMGAYFPGGMTGYTLFYTNAVKRYDRRALVAEARVVGPPVSQERITELFGTTDTAKEDERLLEDLLRRWGGVEPWFAVAPFEYRQEDHPGVLEYQRRLLQLM